MAIVLSLTACGAESTDQQVSASASTSAEAPPPTAEPTPMAAAAPDALPFRDFLQTVGVFGTPTPVAAIDGLTVTVPLPAGWHRYSDPLFATGVDFVSMASDPSLYPSVQLMAIRLDGAFDARDALQYATTDALPPGSTDVVGSFDDYQGSPSLMMQGVHEDSRHFIRMVIADAPSTSSRYLVELIVATQLDQPIAASPELQEIVNGLSVVVT
ncbi:MAG: LpqN/LpqT family lipoprotein [Mycobacterium sp.]